MWCNKMGKVVTKVWKHSVMFTQFLIIPNVIYTKYGLSHVILRNFNSSLVFSSSVFSRIFLRLIADVESFTTSREVSKSDLGWCKQTEEHSFFSPNRFLWVFQGNTEEMKHASLAVSTIITVLALDKTALKSACTTSTSWLLRCID